MSVKKNIFHVILIVIITCLFFFMTSGCKKSISPVESVSLSISESNWNQSYSGSSDTIEVSIQGIEVENVDLGSIRMKGDNPSASPISAVSNTYQGSSIISFFLKSQVFGLLLDPSQGSSHQITVTFRMTTSSDVMELQTEITVNDESDDAIDISTLSLKVEPEEWSLNFSNSSGTVEAFIRGEGIDQIDLDSIEMTGDNSSAQPLTTVSVSINNNQIHARIAKNQVLDILLNPEPGSTHNITVTFEAGENGQQFELTASIFIEDDEDDGSIDISELSLEIDPSEWNMNYINCSGTVEAFIRGDGIELIDLNSIKMEGDNTAAQPLAASSVSITNNQIHARFPKNQVLELLLNPEPGSSHTITITFLEEETGIQFELQAVITIEDDEDDGEVDPSELSLEVVPPQWNLNYSKSSGHVKVFIRGEGIENIDLDSIEMSGDNSAASPLAADSASHQGNHVQADFPKNQVLDLLMEPVSGSVHTITILFYATGGGEQMELSTDITITGN